MPLAREEKKKWRPNIVVAVRKTHSRINVKEVIQDPKINATVSTSIADGVAGPDPGQLLPSVTLLPRNGTRCDADEFKVKVFWCIPQHTKREEEDTIVVAVRHYPCEDK